MNCPDPFGGKVRKALEMVIEGATPKLTEQQFEQLYCRILESEVRGDRKAANILNDFFNENNIRRVRP